MTKMTWARAAAWRAHRQYLDRRAPAGRLLQVTSRLCGLHAQVMSSAELTAWARVEKLERGAVSRALWQSRTLVKTWAMRGTLHLLPAAELSLWHAALGTSGRYLRQKAWEQYFGITLDELDQVTKAIAQVLAGEVMTREELMLAVHRVTGLAVLESKVLANSWGVLFKPAAFAGHLCFGPSVGTRVRFTHPRSWLATEPAAMDAETAVAEVTRRFLAAYAPATVQDLARWWGGGSGIRTARQWIAALGEEAVQVDVEGTAAWMPAADVRKARELSLKRFVRLLPGFDQYVVEASPHLAHLLPGDFRSRIFRPQGWISPVLLVNGRMEGVWRHELKGSRVEVAVEPFRPVPVWARKAAGEEAERLAEFLGGELRLTWKR